MLAHNILVVDDEEFIRANIKNILLDENYNLFYQPAEMMLLKL